MTRPRRGASAPVRHSPLIIAGIIFLVSAIASVLWGDPSAAIIPAALTLATIPPIIVEKWASVQIPAVLLLLYALLLFVSPYMGTYLDFYSVWSPWDTASHFLSGFVIGLGAIYLLGVTERRYTLAMPPWLEGIFVFSVGATVALLWEVSEFIADLTIGTDSQPDNLDTMQDLIAGTVSAAAVAGALVVYRLGRGFRPLGALRHRPTDD